jgi:competence protein ComEC
MWSTLEDTHPLLPLAPRHSRCAAGQRWEWDGVRFEVLHPPSDAYDSKRKSNAMSCVVRIIGDKGTALLTGDIEREQEAWLVATQPEALRSDVLVVPHHGSKTSSTPAFIDAVQPSIAIFQAGYRNRFGHPVPLVRARYDERRIATVDSPACGAWQWSSDSQAARARQGVCERDSGARYWHHGPHKEVDQR